MTRPDYGLDDVALEQRIAELDDAAFDRLVQRTRPPKSYPAKRRRSQAPDSPAKSA